ncbi:hypothetical protein BKA63DRAFT_488745 [Paraphoma chrysanthemicola]|nr:hypothetical protein BKA63DRAFT_488745 [Paraphoma chrysanthemicola]
MDYERVLLTATRRAHVVGDDGIVSPIRRGNDPRLYERLSTQHSSEETNPFAQQLVSSPRVANIRIRRSTCSSALLRSPARAGYTERMRQIFEDAGHEQHMSHNIPTGLYPQLPNISRKASASPVKTEATYLDPTSFSSYRPESLCLSTNLRVGMAPYGVGQASLPHLSQRSSGSWSDDSGYIITTSRGVRSSFLPPLKEQIYSWLAGVSNPEDLAVDGDHASDLTPFHMSESFTGEHEMSSSFSAAKGGEDAVTLTLRTAAIMSSTSVAEDPFLINDDIPETLSAASISEANPMVDDMTSNEHNVPSRLAIDRIGEICTGRQDGDERVPQQLTSYTETTTKPADVQVIEEEEVHLSPLSPNVCVERGPTRYHSNRNLRASNITVTPCKGRASKPALAAQMKENALIGEKGTKGLGILTPHSNGLSIRSRVLQ